jgi:hypothetical protein
MGRHGCAFRGTILCLNCVHGNLIPEECDWRCFLCRHRDICACGVDGQEFNVALEQEALIADGAVGPKAQEILKQAKERGGRMSMNGQPFDRGKDEVAKCRDRMRESRAKGLHTESRCSPRHKQDRGYVGVMVNWFEEEVIPAAMLGEPLTKDEMRAVRLQVISDLIGRPVTSSWDLYFFEAEGWNTWATEKVGDKWQLKAGALETMVMLAVSEQFRRLVKTMPALERVE